MGGPGSGRRKLPLALVRGHQVMEATTPDEVTAREVICDWMRAGWLMQGCAIDADMLESLMIHVARALAAERVKL